MFADYAPWNRELLWGVWWCSVYTSTLAQGRVPPWLTLTFRDTFSAFRDTSDIFLFIHLNIYWEDLICCWVFFQLFFWFVVDCWYFMNWVYYHIFVDKLILNDIVFFQHLSQVPGKFFFALQMLKGKMSHFLFLFHVVKHFLGTWSKSGFLWFFQVDLFSFSSCIICLFNNKRKIHAKLAFKYLYIIL